MSFKNLVKAASELGYSAVELIDQYNLTDEYILSVSLVDARTLADRYGTLMAQVQWDLEAEEAIESLQSLDAPETTETPTFSVGEMVKNSALLSQKCIEYGFGVLDVVNHYNLSPVGIAALDEIEIRCLVDEYDQLLDEGPIALMARELISQKGSVDAALAALR